jgi:hypothetical protein
MKSVATLILVCAILAVALAPLGVAQEPAEKPAAEAEKKTPDLRAAVTVIANKLVRKKDGLRVGMPYTELRKLTPGAAELLGDQFLPLSGSPYSPGEGFAGTVEWYLDSDSNHLDDLRVVLLCPRYDRHEMAKFVLRMGRELRVALEKDEEESDVYWGEALDNGRTLWIALGDGIIVLEVDV